MLRPAFTAILLASLMATHAQAQRGQHANGDVAGIAWYGSWSAGVAEATRLNRPILLIAAAPHCHGVSGIW